MFPWGCRLTTTSSSLRKDLRPTKVGAVQSQFHQLPLHPYSADSNLVLLHPVRPLQEIGKGQYATRSHLLLVVVEHWNNKEAGNTLVVVPQNLVTWIHIPHHLLGTFRHVEGLPMANILLVENQKCLLLW